MAKSTAFRSSRIGVTWVFLVWFAIDVDLNSADNLSEANPIFIFAHGLFLAFFLFEVTVRILALQSKGKIFACPALLFDSVITLLFLLMVAPLGGVPLMRWLRLMQLSRTRVCLEAVPEIAILVKAMFTASRSFFFCICLLLNVMFIFGCALTLCVSDTEISEKYFPTVPRSMFTLLVNGLFFSNIDNVLHDLREGEPVALAMFLIFVLVGVSVMLMGVGVLLEIVSIVANGEKVKFESAFLKKSLADCMSGSNEASAPLSTESLKGAVRNPRIAQCLTACGLDTSNLEQNAELFEGRQYQSIDEFVDEIMRYGNGKQSAATYRDIVELRQELQQIKLSKTVL